MGSTNRTSAPEGLEWIQARSTRSKCAALHDVLDLHRRAVVVDDDVAKPERTTDPVSDERVHRQLRVSDRLDLRSG